MDGNDFVGIFYVLPNFPFTASETKGCCYAIVLVILLIRCIYKKLPHELPIDLRLKGS